MDPEELAVLMSMLDTEDTADRATWHSLPEFRADAHACTPYCRCSPVLGYVDPEDFGELWLHYTEH